MIACHGNDTMVGGEGRPRLPTRPLPSGSARDDREPVPLGRQIDLHSALTL